MRRLFLMSAMVLLVCMQVFSQASVRTETADTDETVYFYTDFTDGIGGDFLTFDCDGQELHFTMKQMGFAQGDAWISKKEEGAKNYYAASTSKYKYAAGETPQPADDWLVTPQIWIKGSKASLTWRGKSFCDKSTNQSSYKVMISTEGPQPDNFVTAPLFVVDKEPSDKWTEYSVSLSAYAGKRVYLAFVNNSLEKEILAIDDVKISGKKGLCEMVVDTESYVYGQSEVQVKAMLTAYTDEAINSFTAYYSHKGQTFSKTVSGLSVGYLDSYSFVFDETMPVQCGDTLRYEVWAEVNGQMLDKVSCQTVSFLFSTHRKIVFEEATGMWCGWCPSGIVAMDLLAGKYPDEFIGVAIHYDDPVSLDKYVKDLQLPSFPSAYVNRKYLCDEPMVKIIKNGKEEFTAGSGGFETYFLQARTEPAVADLKVSANIGSGETEVSVNTRFAVAQQGKSYQLAILFIEDNVTDDDYYQTNYYAKEKTPMGGFESLPSVVKPFVHNHVARYIYDDYRGIPGSVPQQPVVGTDYSFYCTVQTPASIRSLADTKVVALLLDTETGEVLNANEAQDGEVAIGEAKTVNGLFFCEQTGGECRLHITPETGDPIVIDVYSANGMLLHHCCVEAENGPLIYPVDVLNRSGLHVITVRQGIRTSALKVSF